MGKCKNCNREIAGNKKFCSNKGRGNCKDEYHNERDPKRMDRFARLNGYPDFFEMKMTHGHDSEMDCHVEKCWGCGMIPAFCECPESVENL